MPPSSEDWHVRTVEQLIPDGPTHARDGGPDNRRRQQPHHMTHPVETEIPTGVALDQPRGEEGFPCIAEGERDGAPDCPVAGEIGGDGRGHRPDCYRPSCIPPESNQDARGNTGGRPKDG